MDYRLETLLPLNLCTYSSETDVLYRKLYYVGLIDRPSIMKDKLIVFGNIRIGRVGRLRVSANDQEISRKSKSPNKAILEPFFDKLHPHTTRWIRCILVCRYSIELLNGILKALVQDDTLLLEFFYFSRLQPSKTSSMQYWG